MQKSEVCKLIGAIVTKQSVHKENNVREDKLTFVNWFCKN
jgi:hypothetical protein